MNLINRTTSILLTAAIMICFSCEKKTHVTDSKDATKSHIYENISFKMPEVAEPSFPDYAVSIADFGAIAGGQTTNTDAINKAIDAASKNGGGKVIIPRGIWLTGPIMLKSNVNLHTEEGALVIFSKDFDLYPLVETSFEGLNTYRCLSPIYGKDLENIAITGAGVFDGSGDAWRPVKKSKLTEAQWKKKVASGSVLNAAGNTWYPTEKALKGVERSEMNVPTHLKTKEEHEAIKDFLRPVMVSLVNCRKVLIDGSAFQNSPAWCLHPLMCEDITLRNVTVKNPWYSQNGDGLDLESCKNAVIYNCSFDVGDDAICIKSGKNEDGRKRGRPTENVIVKECIVYHGHGGFTVGSEMSGGVRNIHVANCTFIGTDVGLRFKSTRGRGGVVENIYISDINMIDIPAEPILFDLYYSGNSPIPEGDEKVSPADKAKMATMIPPVTDETPSFRDIFMKNVTCKGAGRAVFLQGLPEMNLKNIKLENVSIEADKGLTCIDADGIEMTNVNIMASSGPAMNFRNSKHIVVNGFDYKVAENPVVKVGGELSDEIRFEKVSFSDGQLEIAADVKEGAVKSN